MDDDLFSGAAEQAKDLSPAGNRTSLEVIDMELTNLNVSKSTQLIGSISSDAGAPETAPDGTTVVKQPSQQNTKPTGSHHAAKKTTKESAKEKQSVHTDSKSRKTTTLPGPTILSVYPASDKGMEISEGQDGTSVVVSAPAEKPPVVQKRSLSATTNAQARKVSDDKFSSSPYGIMLPCLARSKTV